MPKRLQERLETLTSFRLGGGLRRLGQDWRDRQGKPDKQRKRLSRYRQITLETINLTGQKIESAGAASR